MKQIDYLRDNLRNYMLGLKETSKPIGESDVRDGYIQCLNDVLHALEHEYNAASVFADTKTREENKELNKTIEEWHYNKIKEIVEGKA